MKENRRVKLTLSNLFNKKGVTLIELIIVLAIIGIIVSVAFSMNIFGVKSFAKGSDRYDLNTKTNLVSEYITKYIRYAYGVEILSSLDTIPDSSTIASSSSPLDAYIFIETVSGKDIVNYRDKVGTRALGEFDNCTLVVTPIELNKTLSFSMTTSIKDESFSVDSGIVPINLLIQSDPQITGTASGVALKIRNDAPTPISVGNLTFNPSNPPNGKVGTVYSGGYSLSASGGTSPYTYVASDSDTTKLPAGMLLSSAGNLSGTPTEAGTFDVGVRVFDSSTPPKSSANTFKIIIDDNVVVDSNAPKVTNVRITGPASVELDRTAAKGSTLSVSYSYSDDEGEAESGSLFTWLISANDNGTGLNEITGATTNTYTPIEGDVGKYIYVKVTPHSIDDLEGYGTMVLCDFPVEILSDGANSKPVASDVSISKSGNVLTGIYTYSDAEGDSEAISIYKWYSDTNQDGSTKTIISGQSNKTFSITGNDYKNKYIFFEVTPKAATGTTLGDPVLNSNVYQSN